MGRTAAEYEKVFREIDQDYYAFDSSKIKSREDLKQALKDYDEQQPRRPDGKKHFSETFLDIMTSTREAQKFWNEKDKLTAQAVRTEFNRPSASRKADESRTAKNVKEINKDVYKQWKRNPAAFDIRGVDTKTHTFIQRETRVRIAKARSAGYRIGGSLFNPYRYEGKSRRSLLTGRYT